MDLELRYGSLFVGTISDAINHQETWLGQFRSCLARDGSALEDRLANFISFCREWNDRLKKDGDADAREFDQFDDLLTSGQWHTRDSAGTLVRICDAPVFFSGSDISWVCDDSNID